MSGIFGRRVFDPGIQDIFGLGGSPVEPKSIQNFTIDVTSTNTSNTASISAVDTANSIVKLDGLIFAGAVDFSRQDNATMRVDLTNATTVTATRPGTGGAMGVTGQVIEWDASIIKSIQNLNHSITSGQTSNDTITAVTVANSYIFYRGAAAINSAASSALTGGNVFNGVELAGSTTVTAHHVSGTNGTTLYYSVVEFID